MSLRHGRTSPVERPDHPLETRHSVLEHSEVMFWDNSIVEGPRHLMVEMLLLPDTPPASGDGVKGLLLLSPKVHDRCFAHAQLEAVLLAQWEIPLFHQFYGNKNEDHPPESCSLSQLQHVWLNVLHACVGVEVKAQNRTNRADRNHFLQPTTESVMTSWKWTSSTENTAVTVLVDTPRAAFWPHEALEFAC